MLDIAGQARLVEIVVAVGTSEPLAFVEMIETYHTQAVGNVANCKAVFCQLQ